MRVFTDGAEMQDLLFWANSGGLAVANSSPSPFASPYFYKGSSGQQKTFPAVSEYYFRQRIYNTNWYSDDGNNGLPIFCSGAGMYLDLRGSSGGLLYLLRHNSSGLASSSPYTILNNTWYLFEIYMLVNSSTGRFVLYVDGVKWIDYTGNTAWGASSHDNFRYNYGSTVSLDDLAMNNTSNADGLNDNSWCGDGIVYKVTPSGSGTLNQWSNSGGVSGSMNYSYVDEFPYDSDTTFVYASASMAGDRDQYVMSDLSLGNKKIRRIWAEGRAKKASADTATVKLGWMPSGYSASLSDAQSLLTSYTAVRGTHSKVNPATSASWTNADLNAIEGVLEV